MNSQESGENPSMELGESSDSDEEYNTPSSGSSDVSSLEAAATELGQAPTAGGDSSNSTAGSASSSILRKRASRFLTRPLGSPSRSSSASSQYSTPPESGLEARLRRHRPRASGPPNEDGAGDAAAAAENSSDATSDGEQRAEGEHHSLVLEARLATDSSPSPDWSSDDNLNLNPDDRNQNEDATRRPPTLQGAIRGPRWRRRATTAEEEAKYDTTPKCPRPCHKWNAVVEMDRRGTYGNPGVFRNRCYGSLRSVERLELMAKLDGHWGCVNSVSFCPEGHLLASGSDDLHCMIWEWQRNRALLVFETGHRSNVFQSKFLPNRNNTAIVTAARDGAVRLHELCDGGSAVESSRKIAYHRGPVHKVAMHYSMQETLMSTGEDGVVNEIDLRLPNPNTLLTVEDDRPDTIGLYSIAINPCRPFEFCIAGLDPYVRVYDRRNVKISETVRKLCPNHLAGARTSNLAVSCAVYNFDGSEILATYSDEDIYIFNNHPPHNDADQDFLHRFQGHRNNQTVKSVNYFGLRSEYVVSGSDCGHIFLWDKKTAHIVNYLHGDEGGVVNVLEPNPCAPYLATSGFDHNVKIWAPSADEPPDLTQVRMHTMENIRQREMEVRRSEEYLTRRNNGSLMLYLMNVMPSVRTAHMEARLEDRSNGSGSSSDEEIPLHQGGARGQCPPS
ncbi:DDB1- and CUL4-associated factor 8-like isoform X2 [Varroa jacobsoni]|uniref:DDB1- and CUL4-associated factor 8-like isoform X2 n=1 Tax=Varroa jacobsoni TaxID=62625 RepID=UPI000BF772E3|nr:DDB1- and CUL4-associated factor 8-like isoform X2 [Varroa jacobsoni]